MPPIISAKPNGDPNLAWETVALQDRRVGGGHRSPNVSNLTLTRGKTASIGIKWSDLLSNSNRDGAPAELESVDDQTLLMSSL